MSDIIQEKNEIVVQEGDVINQVTESINKLLCDKAIKVTNDIVPENAIKFAFITLQETYTKDRKNVLQVCSKASIQKALLKMLVLGLDPAKKQCYFVPYDNRLELVVSYFGKIALAKRCGLVSIAANIVYKDDVFSIYVDKETGYIKLNEHIPNLQTKEIVGAYAITRVKQNNESNSNLVYMSIEEIKKCWMMNKLYSVGGDSIHSKFTEEMCKKTVMSRALKIIINSSYETYAIDEEDILNNETESSTIMEV